VLTPSAVGVEWELYGYGYCWLGERRGAQRVGRIINRGGAHVGVWADAPGSEAPGNQQRSAPHGGVEGRIEGHEGAPPLNLRGRRVFRGGTPPLPYFLAPLYHPQAEPLPAAAPQALSPPMPLQRRPAEAVPQYPGPTARTAPHPYMRFRRPSCQRRGGGGGGRWSVWSGQGQAGLGECVEWGGWWPPLDRWSVGGG
jgi:hypothetical protein